MCGIAGEFVWGERRANADAVARMLPCLERRGPDADGLWASGRVALGHRRLSILDLSQRAHQPMFDPETGLSLVFNGAIYNFRALRSELEGRGHRFFSSGDTEVILRGYAEWGEGVVARLHGMFAFALFDGEHQRLLLARDRMGIKPLYLARTGDGIRFASNTAALLAGGGVDTELDPEGLHMLFSLHAVVPAPRTVLRGVRKLEPGHYITIDAHGQERQQCYWQLNARRPAEAVSDAEWQERIEAGLRRAVRRRLEVADVPVGVLLSGGLDSSLLVALAMEEGAQDLRTFTVGFEDQPEEKGSEFEYSDPVAERYATDHQATLIPNDQVLARLPEAVEAMAEPMFGQDAVAFYLLSEQVSQHVKVVQSGQGADEVFGGYFWYPQMAEDRHGDWVERFRRHYFDRDHPEMAEMLRHPPPNDVTGEWLREQFHRLESDRADSFIDAVLALDVTTLIVDDPVKRVDNMTMAFGLEARVPFLDHELVETAAAMPPHLKLGDGGKDVLRRIARGRLPDAVLDRPKGYFPVPALKYVRGDFLDFMRDILNSRAARERGLYQPAYIDKLLDAPDQYFTRIQGSKLWHAALLEYWLQVHVDG
ncbi:N-acetylglutaminylglutamine amidotransferase [Thioalkalivibrio halophilus]|uniref:asparagine synthase (glutamine-hydrolyzing) n=1 Tax=Thioalkalivibrio halophilus TaxID=252474 RepID=A0A1V3A0I8_9GAMM|nr:N-acetylglutaminylglutamine amidotransferase [Thioalkalivibrio halophilus]OOC10870.1 asparagine synthase (glutamine-hydrolyzing) [Thioalkalivibrio halophilus]